MAAVSACLTRWGWRGPGKLLTHLVSLALNASKLRFLLQLCCFLGVLSATSCSLSPACTLPHTQPQLPP